MRPGSPLVNCNRARAVGHVEKMFDVTVTHEINIIIFCQAAR